MLSSANVELNKADLPRIEWVTLNRVRANVGKICDERLKWGYAAIAECPCQAKTNHGLYYNILPKGLSCTDDDLRVVNNTAGRWLRRSARYDDNDATTYR